MTNHVNAVVVVDRQMEADIQTIKKTDYIASPEYSSFENTACTNFWDYYYKKKDFVEDYRTKRVQINTLAGTEWLTAPAANPF